MAKPKVFYSFYFDDDVMRTQQVRQMGVIEGKTPVTKNDWETIKKSSGAVEKWIDDNIKWSDCVVVLIGTNTHSRHWVKHEIKRAWELNKGLLGIHIHNLNCPNNGTCAKGNNPFYAWQVNGNSMANLISVYDPNNWDAYNDIASGLVGWVNTAIAQAKTR